MSSYIKIDRRILEWEWYQNEHTKNVFLHCLLKANWKDGKWEGKKIPRGSFVTSVKRISLELALTEDEVKTALKHLLKTGEITKQTTNKYSVITVSNYDLYQEVTKQNPNNSRTDTEQLQNNSTSIPNLLPTIEESKEIKESNNNIVRQIVERLNFLAGTKYRTNTDSTKRIIKARLSDGYTLNDFYAVIDKKTKEWKGTEMEKYLRPQTLFGTKFESYLNQNDVPRKKSNNFNNFPQRNPAKEEMKDLEKQLLGKG